MNGRTKGNLAYFTPPWFATATVACLSHSASTLVYNSMAGRTALSGSSASTETCAEMYSAIQLYCYIDRVERKAQCNGIASISLSVCLFVPSA